MLAQKVAKPTEGSAGARARKRLDSAEKRTEDNSAKHGGVSRRALRTQTSSCGLDQGDEASLGSDRAGHGGGAADRLVSKAPSVSWSFGRIPVLAPQKASDQRLRSALNRALSDCGEPLAPSVRNGFERAFLSVPNVPAADAGRAEELGGWKIGAADSRAEQAAREAGDRTSGSRAADMEGSNPGRFSEVRVHRGTSAARAGEALAARAFTLRNHVFFGAGQYDPYSTPGRRLIGHELTHVLQARNSGLTGSPASSVIMRDLSVEGIGKWYDAKKWAVYRGLIGALKSAKTTSFKFARSQIPRIPQLMQGFAGQLLDVGDFVADLIIALLLAIVGMAAGFAEGIVGLVKGLIMLAYHLVKLMVEMIVAMIGMPEAYMNDVRALVSTIQKLVPGMVTFIEDWKDRYAKATLEEQVIMGGEVIGQVEAFIASFGTVGARAGQAAAGLGEAGAARAVGGGAAALERAPALVPVAVVAKTAAEGAVVSQQMMMMSSQGPGATPPAAAPSGGKAPSSSSSPPGRPGRLGRLGPEEVDKALDPIDTAKHPHLQGGEGASPVRGAAQVLKVAPLDLPNMVTDAANLLKSRGINGLRPSEYGTKLHAALNEVAQSRAGEAAGNWEVFSEQKLGDIVKIRPENAGLKVRQYLGKYGLTKQYPKFSEKILDSAIGSIKPDIMVRAPNGQKLVWDLTSELAGEHLAKTMFYAEVVGREEGGLIRVSEDYWRTVPTD